MKPLGILQHDRKRGPEALVACLRRRSIAYRVLHVAEGETVPRSGLDFSGLALLGSHRSVHEPLAWIDAETALVRQCLADDVAVLGFGFGAQLMARAAGATLARTPGATLGWNRVHVTPPGREWLGSSASLEMFSWHCESFTLPAGAQRILFGEHCQNIGYVMGRHVALQCQLDLSAEALDDWAARLKTEALRRPGVSLPGEDQLLANGAERLARLRPILERVYLRWLDALPGATSGASRVLPLVQGVRATGS